MLTSTISHNLETQPLFWIRGFTVYTNLIQGFTPFPIKYDILPRNVNMVKLTRFRNKSRMFTINCLWSSEYVRKIYLLQSKYWEPISKVCETGNEFDDNRFWIK